jgi:hypothetical protein
LVLVVLVLRLSTVLEQMVIILFLVLLPLLAVVEVVTNPSLVPLVVLAVEAVVKHLVERQQQRHHLKAVQGVAAPTL